MQLFAGFIDDDFMSRVFKIDDEEDEEYFFEAIGDPIYDESDDEEEIIGEHLSSQIFNEIEKEEEVKIAFISTINQAYGVHKDFVNMSSLLEVELRSLEFIMKIILLPQHLKMHQIRGRILSNSERMMRAEFCVQICRSNFRGPYLLTRLSDLRVQHIKSKRKTRSLIRRGEFVKNRIPDAVYSASKYLGPFNVLAI